MANTKTKAKADPKPTTYDWKIVDADRLLVNGMIYTSHFMVIATNEDKKLSVSDYGSVGFPPADPKTMIPYDQVTEAELLAWTQSRLGKERVRGILAGLDARLEYAIHPTEGHGLPWVK